MNVAEAQICFCKDSTETSDYIQMDNKLILPVWQTAISSCLQLTESGFFFFLFK